MNDNMLSGIGMTGMCISGVGVSRGYLGRPELTAESLLIIHMEKVSCIEQEI